MELKELIRDVPNFPREGIVFKDITTLIKNPQAFKEAVEMMIKPFEDDEIDLVVAVESRGYIFGGAIAYKIGKGIEIVRKPGKLPADTVSEKYELEYGTNTLEIHKDAVKDGERVLIVDDLLATGGTALATAKLVERLGGRVIGISFLIELTFLNGRDKLKNYKVETVIKY